jgi:hypothetical protein
MADRAARHRIYTLRYPRSAPHHAEEIELVISEYLLAHDVAGRMPTDVAREIVEVARVAVPKVRKLGRHPLDRTKLSTAVAAALEKLWRNEPLRRPVSGPGLSGQPNSTLVVTCYSTCKSCVQGRRGSG